MCYIFFFYFLFLLCLTDLGFVNYRPKVKLHSSETIPVRPLFLFTSLNQSIYSLKENKLSSCTFFYLEKIVIVVGWKDTMMRTTRTQSKSSQIMNVTFCFWKKHKILSEKVVRVVGIYRMVVVVLFQFKPILLESINQS